MANIALIITTFLRDSLLYKCLQSIVDNPIPNIKILVADQGYNDDEKNITIDYYKSQLDLEYYKLPFDCGAYYARNFLFKKTKEFGISYCLVMADSIHFCQQYNFSTFIKFLEQNEKTALIGFELDGSKCPWEFLMTKTEQHIKFDWATEKINFENISLTKVDICRNIYLAKTNVMIDCPQDEELKLGGHELNFWNLKQRGYDCYWTDTISFKRFSPRASNEYDSYRKRLSYYLKIAKQKLDIKGWVKYPEGWNPKKYKK